jgi:hypothetical protein
VEECRGAFDVENARIDSIMHAMNQDASVMTLLPDFERKNEMIEIAKSDARPQFSARSDNYLKLD